MTMPNHDLTKAEVMKLLNITPWQWRQVSRELPCIRYSARTVRYAAADVAHYREGRRQGGWLEKKNDKRAA